MSRWGWVLVLVLLNSARSRSATFENVEVQLHDGFDVPTKDRALIVSDDFLGNYVNKQRARPIVLILNQTIPVLTEGSINLMKTQQLSIISCGLKEIRPGAFKTPLETLDLSHNVIEEIKNGVFQGLSIKELHLEHNEISKIEDEAFNDMELEALILNNNKIMVWSWGWFKGTKLLSVDVQSNLLEEIPANSLWSSQLDESANTGYNFEANHIKNIQPGAFWGFKQLKELNLRGNFLKNIQPGVFGGVEVLESLVLNNNQITQLSMDSFNNLTTILVLEIKNNKLNCISTEVLDRLKVQFVRLQGNPITCECIEMMEDWQWKLRNDKRKLEKVSQMEVLGPLKDLEMIKDGCVE